MRRYYVFYGEQLHSEYMMAIDFWKAKDRGEIPEGSYRYCNETDEWVHITYAEAIKSVDVNDVPPLLRAMALMLGG